MSESKPSHPEDIRLGRILRCLLADAAEYRWLGLRAGGDDNMEEIPCLVLDGRVDLDAEDVALVARLLDAAESGSSEQPHVHP